MVMSLAGTRLQRPSTTLLFPPQRSHWKPRPVMFLFAFNCIYLHLLLQPHENSTLGTCSAQALCPCGLRKEARG